MIIIKIMTIKKKTYQQPEMKVVELEQADIIATSGTETEELTEDVFEF